MGNGEGHALGIPSLFLVTRLTGYGWCQPQVTQTAELGLHIVPSVGHGCGYGALFGVGPSAGTVHVCVEPPTRA